jgi:hypothetical protein
MRQPPTGEPCAGEPPARFGGRGGFRPFPTPINSTLQGAQALDFDELPQEEKIFAARKGNKNRTGKEGVAKSLGSFLPSPSEPES